MNRYIISIEGFSPEEFIADSASKARYAAYRALRDIGLFKGRGGFRDFLDRAYTMHLGEEYGDPRTPQYGVAQ